MKAGRLVTVKLGANNTASNVFEVAKQIDGLNFLHHPLMDELFILKTDSELDVEPARPKDPDQKCLEYVLAHQQYLGYEDTTDLEALCMFFVVRRRFSNRQKHFMSSLGGKIASKHCNEDINIAIRTVRSNKALLNDFNQMWYLKLEKFFLEKKPITTPNIRLAIFNMAGFILAQLYIM